jgi:hypothetical protein
MARAACVSEISTSLEAYMFLFPRPFAAVLAAFTTSGVFLLIGVLLQHAGN